MPGLPLVTGAAGFAGSHLIEELNRFGPAHAWAHRAEPPRDPGQTNPGTAITWTAVDLLDRAQVRSALASARPSVIYHCAGIADVQDAWRAPARALRVNVLGTHNLVDSIRDLHLACPVLVTGSAQVYRPSLAALREDDAIGPENPYGVSKLAQEMTAAASGLPVWLVRPFNHVGPRQSPAYATPAFAQQIAEIEAGRREPVLHVGNLEAQRDVTDVRDTVRAYRLLTETGQTGRVYNVCSGRAYSMRHLLDVLLSLARVKVRITVDTARLRPSDNPVVVGSRDRLTADTGWTPVIPIEQTLADLLDFWRHAPQPAFKPSPSA